MFYKLLLTLSSFICFLSCQSTTPPTTTPSNQLLQFKSAIIEYDKYVLGEKAETHTLYIDDWGKHISMERELVKLPIKHQILKIADQYYMVEERINTYTKMPTAPLELDILLQPQTKNTFQEKEEELNNKKCVVYRDTTLLDSRYWMYKGIVLQSISTTLDDGSESLKLINTRFEENATIPPNTFELKQDFTIK